jgi:peptidoglycan/xylan/chitin deacetylase (PgdA/CDA1 family)
VAVIDRLFAAFLRNAGGLRGGVVGCLFTFHRAARSNVWASLPNRDFYVNIEFLDRLLAYLMGCGWSIVTIEEAVRRSAAGGASRFVNFSIDDCYRDTYELVVPLFRKHGVPITLFVTTGIPDGTLSMWQVGLEQALSQRRTAVINGQAVDIASHERKRAVFETTAAAWDGPGAMREYAAFCTANGVDAGEVHAGHAMTWEMLEKLVGDPCVEIGSHTVDHSRISSLGEEDAFAELERSRLRLEERLGIAVRHFAFPYGRSGDCGERDFALVRKAGYRSASTTRKGLVTANADPLRLPRNTLNGRHQRMLHAEFHLTGASGVAARMLARV